MYSDFFDELNEIYLNESSELYSGVFWIPNLDDINKNKNYCFQIPTLSSGEIDSDGLELNAKSGTTYNHEKLWNQLSTSMTNNNPYNYYPRGRVQITNGKAIIYLNPNINTEEVQEFIKDEYNLTERNGIKKIIFNSDGSDHYKCYLDEK